MLTIAQLQKGESATILDFPLDAIPLKLIEMGCLPGNQVTLVQTTLFKDPMYVRINGSNVAIRRSTADYIQVKKHG